MLPPVAGKEDSDSEESIEVKRTPKMSALFGKNIDVSTCYYRGLDFLYKQKDFDDTFDTDPPILNAIPVGKFDNDNTTAKKLLEFSDQCRLYV